MAPVISPKKSWEGFAGSTVFCVLAGWATVVYLFDGHWWVGVLLGLVAVVAATMGDLCESVIKRDLGIKDMSQIVPGHGGLMDRLDSLLATAAPTWLVLHYLVFGCRGCSWSGTVARPGTGGPPPRRGGWTPPGCPAGTPGAPAAGSPRTRPGSPALSRRRSPPPGGSPTGR
jgi:hypothetical protein